MVFPVVSAPRWPKLRRQVVGFRLPPIDLIWQIGVWLFRPSGLFRQVGEVKISEQQIEFIGEDGKQASWELETLPRIDIYYYKGWLPSWRPIELTDVILWDLHIPQHLPLHEKVKYPSFARTISFRVRLTLPDKSQQNLYLLNSIAGSRRTGTLHQLFLHLRRRNKSFFRKIQFWEKY